MKTLYVSDLDGTLLRRNQHTSQYTNDTINRLVEEEGMIFSYATARSFVTSHKAAGFTARFPVITYNGAAIIDNADGHIITKTVFGDEIRQMLWDLISQDIYPLVYAYRDGVERFSFIEDKCSPEAKAFIKKRVDERALPVCTEGELLQGDIFYVSCMGYDEKLPHFYEKYKGQFRCLLQRDIYTNAMWFETMQKNVKKSAAVLQLKEMLGCDRVVAFGDGLNDLDMFGVADECYAVANAEGVVKLRATAVIGSNDEDGVAHWLEENFKG
ncbi:MAG: HAD-IIB family hydrolase [Ruminococcus sp.]|nr:HAD-IIB family hydrolase [Ruminococcus sp.]